MAMRLLRIAVRSVTVILLFGSAAVQPANAQSETVLYNFTNASKSPGGGLLMDSSGNLFGTTSSGGSAPCFCGTVFELVNSSGSYTEDILYSFGATSNDGEIPFTGLAMDSAGNLYGTTYQGGAFNAGTAFELVNSAGNYTEKILYSFGATATDASHPGGSGNLIIDSAGNLYGAAGSAALQGVVFELVKSSSGYTEKLLYTFPAGEGGAVMPLILDSDGNFWGAADDGGPAGDGTVFELVNTGGNYTEKVIYSFAGPPNDGRNPSALIMDSAGNLFGTTQYGGSSANCSNNCGTVFELVNSAGSYTERLLHSFTGGNDGFFPLASLIMDPNGRLYGTTSGGNGTLFEVANSSGGYAEYVLHEFSGSPDDGASPYGPVMLDSSGNLYGTTQTGGANGDGTAYEFTNASALTLTLTPPILNFGNQLLTAPGTTQSVTVTNISPANLTFASGAVMRSGTNAADFAIASDACSGRTLAPETGACTVAVTYTPSVLGSETAALSFADDAFGNPQTVPLSGTGQDFSLSAPDLSTTVSRGNDATFYIYVTPLGGFTGTVALTCAGAPANSTCTVDPASLAAAGNIASTVAVGIETNGSMLPHVPAPPVAPPVAMWIVLAGLWTLGMLVRSWARGTSIRVLVPLVLLMTLAFAMSCGGGGGAGGNSYHSPPTPTGTFPLTISGTSGGVTHTLALTLTVQ